MAKNSVIVDEKVAGYQKEIARKKGEVAALDKKADAIAKERAFLVSEIFQHELAIKSLKGTAGDTSSSETSLKEPPTSDDDVVVSSHLPLQHADAAADVTSASASREERANASHYQFVTHMNSVEELMGHRNSEPELRLNSTFIKPAGANKKIRCIEFLSTNTDQFLFSGDDGYIRKWQLDPDMIASPVLAFDAKWRGSFPHRISINPTEESVVAVYGPNERLLVFSLFGTEELGDGIRKTVIEETPHQRGISQVAFMPWRNNGHPVFISSGNLEHDIASWGLFDSAWKTTGRHFMHTNLVTGICGLYNEFIVISVGRDKLISALDLEQGKQIKEDQVDSECQGVAANPVNLNLLCVQTSTQKNQLRLWDVRERGEQLSFGWMNNGKVSRTTLVDPAWSPSGLLLSAGSADREVKIFDIRYNEKRAPLTCEKHDNGRVFKVAWAPNQRVLLSTSAKEIGLHRYT